MARQDATAAEIRQAVQDAVDAIREVAEDHADIRIPLPQWNEDDPSGCNWHIRTFNGDPIYRATVDRIVSGMMARYRLVE